MSRDNEKIMKILNFSLSYRGNSNGYRGAFRLNYKLFLKKKAKTWFKIKIWTNTRFLQHR